MRESKVRTSPTLSISSTKKLPQNSSLKLLRKLSPSPPFFELHCLQLAQKLSEKPSLAACPLSSRNLLKNISQTSNEITPSSHIWLATLAIFPCPFYVKNSLKLLYNPKISLSSSTKSSPPPQNISTKR